MSWENLYVMWSGNPDCYHSWAQFFCRCFVLMLSVLCFVLRASCFVLKITSFGQNWLLCAHALCFVLGRAWQKTRFLWAGASACCCWPSAPCACGHLLRAHVAICSVRMLCASCFVLGERWPKNPISTKHEHGAQSTKHEHKAQSSDKKTGLCRDKIRTSSSTPLYPRYHSKKIILLILPLTLALKKLWHAAVRWRY
jgi:hypothetical protein